MVKTFNIDFPGWNILSVDERKCFLILEKLDGDSLWLTAIKNVCKNPDSYRFRKLVCELKSQAADSHEVMKNILGEEAMNAIVKL